MVSTNSQDAAVNFQSKEAKILYQDLLKEQNELNSVNARLAQLRQEFHNANASAKKVMKNEILKLEDKVLELNTNVKQLNKAIRNAEIKSKKQ